MRTALFHFSGAKYFDPIIETSNMSNRKYIFICIISLISLSVSATDIETDSLIRIYDKLIETGNIHIRERQQRIDNLVNKLNRQQHSPNNKYILYQKIYEEYRPYISDSAIAYLNRCITTAEQLGDSNLVTDSKLKLSYLLASIGLYKESADILATIREADLPQSQLIEYYFCMEHAYGEMSYYSKEARLSNSYREISNKYKELQKKILPHNDDRYLSIIESDYRNIRDFKMSLKINDIRLKSFSENSREYALIAFLRSLTYKESGDELLQQKWLLKSAISDLRFGITDNASSWELANLMYKRGDIKHAHLYINYSVNNATIFNARLRFTQIAEVQSIINNAYLIDKAQQEKKLRRSLILISILTLLLLTSVIGIFFQNRRISNANAKTIKANDELNRLNWELSRIISEINNTNAELSESNQVKEEYIGHFLSLCSLYIDKMDAYRKTIRKKLLNNQQSEVMEDVKSSDFMDNELKEFYNNFDRSFLRLYPDFVHEFNNLLMDEEKIILKKDELLNTELRIFALIRLGIDNSAKIAELLHYSANTIYNYRAKIKNKSKVSRNDFENMVKKIGTFTR